MPSHVGSFLGEWWLPHVMERRVPGVLSIGEDGDLRLETTTSLDADNHDASSRLASYPVVHGTTERNEVTLLDVIPSDTYVPNSCVFGALLQSGELAFRRMRIGFRELSWFTGASGLDRTVTADGLTDTWMRPPVRRTRVTDGANVELTFSWSGPQVQGRLAIEETAYFEVQLNLALDINSFDRQYIGPLRQLVSLAFGESVAPSIVEVFTPLATSHIGNNIYEEPLELIRPVIHPRNLSNARRRPVFRLDDLPGAFEGALPRWYELARTLEPALGIYFGAYFGRPAYREDELLLFLMAAESYHRLSPFQQKTSQKDAARWQSVLDSAPDELRMWLIERIEQATERRLWERLRDITDHSGPVGRVLARRIPRFPTSLATWRNRLIHNDPNDDSGRLSGAKMAQACMVLRCLITGCLLRDLGVGGPKIEQLLRTSHMGRYAMEWEPSE